MISKQKIIISLFLLLFMSFGWGTLDRYEPYLSPGIEIGFNSNKELFYGFQISMGVSYPSDYNQGILYSPSICFGFKKYHKSNLNEKYIDLQMMSFPDGRLVNWGFEDWNFIAPIGFGVGVNYFNDQSSMRIKGYTWFMSCLTFDYDFKRKLSNISLIPVFPISDRM